MTTEDNILKFVSDHLRISTDEMRGKARWRAIVEARQIFCYICRKLLPLSLRQIGNVINKDHATVLHSVKAIENRIFVYPNEKTFIDNLMITVKEEVDFLDSDIFVDNEEVFLENDCYKN